MRVLCLSGGGSKGSDQAGRLAALIESGATFDAIVGVSVGAVNGSIVSVNGSVKDLWWSLSGTHDLMRLSLRQVWNMRGLYHFGPLKKKIIQFYSGKEVRSGIPCHVVFCDLTDGSIHAKSQYEAETAEERADHILASSSVAFIHEPIQGRYVDGGHRDATPIRFAIEGLKATHVTCIVTEPEVRDPGGNWSPSWPYIASNGLRAVGMMAHEIFQTDIELMRYKYPTVDVRVLRPSKPLSFSDLDYTPEIIRGAFESGYAETKELLGVQ